MSGRLPRFGSKEPSELNSLASNLFGKLISESQESEQTDRIFNQELTIHHLLQFFVFVTTERYMNSMTEFDLVPPAAYMFIGINLM
jgi:hypothetical protein